MASRVARPVKAARPAFNFHQVSSNSRMRAVSVVPLSAARCKALLVDFIRVRVYGAMSGRSTAVAE